MRITKPTRNGLMWEITITENGTPETYQFKYEYQAWDWFYENFGCPVTKAIGSKYQLQGAD